MSLVAVLTTINNELIATGTLPLGAKVKFGPSSLFKRESPPCVSWVPKRSSGTPPTGAMSRSAQQALAQTGQAVPRALWNREVDLECHVWAGGPGSGDDYSSVESLLNSVVSAVHHTLGSGSYTYRGDEYVGKGTDAATLGHAIVIHFLFKVPLIELPTTAPLKAPQAVVVTSGTISVQEGPLQPGGSTTTVPATLP